MIKYVRANTEYASDELWGWVCSGDDAALRKYYTDGGRVGTKYRRFNVDHSLIMGAVRNANFDTAHMLAKYGENVSADEMWELQKIYEDMTEPQASSAFSESEISKVADLIDILSGNRGVQKVPEYWYLTKHGLGPGTLPKRVNVVDAIAGDNFDTYVRLDTPLTYEEEQNYEIHPSDKPEW